MGEIKKKASFTLKKTDYDGVLSKIQSSNTALERLLQYDKTLHPSRRRRSQARVRKLLRGLSGSIFNAMHSAITCDCANTHTIGIELAARHAVIVRGDNEDEIAAKIDYDVVIDSFRAPTVWNLTKLQFDKGDPASKESEAPSSPVVEPPKKPRKKVAWHRRLLGFSATREESTPGQDRVQVEASETISPSGMGSSRQPQPLSLISNLCEVFHGKPEALSTSESYGYISTGDRNFRLSPPNEEPSSFCHSLTLRGILSDLSVASNRKTIPFGNKEKLQLVCIEPSLETLVREVVPEHL